MSVLCPSVFVCDSQSSPPILHPPPRLRLVLLTVTTRYVATSPSPLDLLNHASVALLEARCSFGPENSVMRWSCDTQAVPRKGTSPVAVMPSSAVFSGGVGLPQVREDRAGQHVSEMMKCMENTHLTP